MLVLQEELVLQEDQCRSDIRAGTRPSSFLALGLCVELQLKHCSCNST